MTIGRSPAFIIGTLALLVIFLIVIRWLGGATFNGY